MESTKDRHRNREEQGTELDDRIQATRRKAAPEDRIQADHQDDAAGQVLHCCFHIDDESRNRLSIWSLTQVPFPVCEIEPLGEKGHRVVRCEPTNETIISRLRFASKW